MKDVLNERVQDRRMKTPPYTRPRLRCAYLSLRRNMGRLWTFCDYKDRIIPNTNNGLEAVFADIKSKEPTAGSQESLGRIFHFSLYKRTNKIAQ